MSAVDPVQEIGYLSEWPPPLKGSQNQSICSRSPKQKQLKRCATGTSDLQNHQHAAKRLKCETRASMAANVLDNMSPLVISLITSNTNLMRPDVMLSRWWKRKSDDMSTNLFPSESQRELCCNPRTKLHQITRLPEGQHILSQRIAYLQEKLSDLESSPSEAVSSIHFINIASCYHSLSSNLGHTCSALEHDAQRALDLSEGDGEIEWLIQQLVRQKDAEENKLEKIFSVRGMRHRLFQCQSQSRVY